MSADIILLKHPDIRIETNPQIIVCASIPHESTKRNLARLGFNYIAGLGEHGIFSTFPPGWAEQDVSEAYRSEFG